MNITENTIKKALRESISHFLLTESFKSSKLRNFFKEHGGVNKEYFQKSLGDISDEQIMLFDVFESYNDAMDEKHRLIYKTRPDHRHRSQYDMACLFEIYVANDGCAALVGIDRDSIKTGMTWGGEKEKKVADRFWRKQSFTPYNDTDEYHYSRRGYGPDFGLHTSGDYKRKLGNLKDKRDLFDKEGFDFNDWRGKELERMQSYIKRNPKYDGRDEARIGRFNPPVKEGKIRESDEPYAGPDYSRKAIDGVNVKRVAKKLGKSNIDVRKFFDIDNDDYDPTYEMFPYAYEDFD